MYILYITLTEIIRAALKTTATAFYAISKANLIRQVALWDQQLPNIKPYYAVKSNPNPKILQWLRETNKVRLDCASPAEIALALRQGFTPSDIIYANTMKSVNDVKEAPKLGVTLTTVDSVEAVEQIAATANWRPDILVRLAVNDAESRSPFSIKFGATEKEWRKITDAIDYHKLSFQGVSFHAGSQAKPAAFGDAIQMCQRFQQSLNRYVPIVDIGGGFLPEKRIFKETAKIIRAEQQKWPTSTKWIAEPGRFFSSTVQTLCVPIVFKKESEENTRYILDDSLYGQFTNIVFDHGQPHWHSLQHKHQPSKKDALFFGKTCDSADFIAVERNAPDYKVGDWFIFPNMGAYTSATASEFNGFSKPTMVYINKRLSTKIKENKNVLFPMSLHSEIKLSKTELR